MDSVSSSIAASRAAEAGYVPRRGGKVRSQRPGAGRPQGGSNHIRETINVLDRPDIIYHDNAVTLLKRKRNGWP